MNGWFDIKDVQPHETGKIWVAYIEPVLIDGKPKKVWASARALKSGKVERV